MAVVGGVEAAVSLHIDRGDDVNARDDRGMTPLMLAAAKNRARICRLLIAAGADPLATDAFGNDARDIALSAGARDAAREIDSAMGTAPCDAPITDEIEALYAIAPTTISQGDERSEESSEGASRLENLPLPTAIAPTEEVVDAWLPGEMDPSESISAVSMAVEIPEAEAELSIGDDALIDLSGWEPDEETPPPVGDASLALAPTAIHVALSLHEPVDDSADWSDFEAFLPEQAAPLPRSDNAKAATELRALLLRALREGSVPTSAVDDFDGVSEASTTADPKSPLRYVIEDLGAETDERFEYRAPHESFEVHVDPAETADEEWAIDEALSFLADLESRRNDPMRHYMREAQRKALIGADEEVALAKAMENASREAVDCLAQWPKGLALVFEAIDSVKAGDRLANSVVTGAREDDHNHGGASKLVDASPETESAARPDLATETKTDGEELGRNGLDEATLFAKTQSLRNLVESADASDPASALIRAASHDLRLSRSFLLRLGDRADATEPARRFSAATRRLSAVRDRMAGANLRLVLSHAKRYLFSGIPMDDLIQEGNIGLLRAVDKFDWRRGYKFSTMATWWIRQQISRSVADAALAIRLPVHFRDDVHLIERAGKDLEKALGKAPSIEQLASQLDMNPGKVATALRAVSAPLSIDELEEELASAGSVAPDPFDALAASQLGEAIAAALDGLDSKPAKVVRLRFGIGVAEPCTLEEVGQLFDVTRERIRQIEARAMRRLMHPTRADTLRPWLDRAPSPKKRKQEDSPAPTEAAETDTQGPNEAAFEPAQEVDTGPEAMERLLARAAELGIAVEQIGSDISSATWVLVDDEARDNQTRGVVRRLLALGFAHWPGRGYWK